MGSSYEGTLHFCEFYCQEFYQGEYWWVGGGWIFPCASGKRMRK